MSLSIKLVFNNEIHRVTKAPPTFKDLQQYCSSIFHYPAFLVRYEDEEGDMITIASELDLQTAYSSSSSNRSLRLLLSLPNSSNPEPSFSNPEVSERSSQGVKSLNSSDFIQEEGKYTWTRHTCDGCNTKPIVGARFHCTVCGDFDYCETCEREIPHQHPFMKFLKETEDQYINIDFNPQNLFQSLLEIKNFFCNQKPKMTVQEHCILQGKVSEDILIRWKVSNSGNCQWPRNCFVTKVKGNFDAEFLSIPELMPGETGEIVARMQCEGGNLKAKWRVSTSNGLKIGNLKAKGYLQNMMSEKIQTLVDMGCDPILAEEVILKAGGNLEQAVKIIFP